jgi:hypothetical protein
MTGYHVVQYNIAKLRAPLDDPLLKTFVDRLDELNHLADRSPGFVWRLHTEDGTSTTIRPYEDESIIINMSTWETIESLHAYAYRSDHGPVYAARHDWFEPMDGHTLVLWWVHAGEIPDASQGKIRLELLRRRGPSPEAFTLKKRFPPPE